MVRIIVGVLSRLHVPVVRGLTPLLEWRASAHFVSEPERGKGGGEEGTSPDRNVFFKTLSHHPFTLHTTHYTHTHKNTHTHTHQVQLVRLGLEVLFGSLDEDYDVGESSDCILGNKKKKQPHIARVVITYMYKG